MTTPSRRTTADGRDTLLYHSDCLQRQHRLTLRTLIGERDDFERALRACRERVRTTPTDTIYRDVAEIIDKALDGTRSGSDGSE